jgi:CheY-like chemotaxis protein
MTNSDRGDEVRQRLEFAPPDGTLKVLVVDDNADALMLMAMRLRKLGHDVQKAPDGLTALRVAQDYKPDVVLLDIAMPGIDGCATAKQLRERDPEHRTLLVALTGYEDDETRRRAEDAGFDHHVVKPLETAHLQQLLVRTGMNA